MNQPTRQREERRQSIRIEPPGLMSVNYQTNGGEPIADAEVLNLSVGGAELRSPKAIVPGDRIAFSVGGGHATITCQVLACDRLEDGWFHIRCKCILGGFDL